MSPYKAYNYFSQDAFGSVHDILHQTDVKHQLLARSIEGLPLRPSTLKYPSCLDEELLLLKVIRLSQCPRTSTSPRWSQWQIPLAIFMCIVQVSVSLRTIQLVT